jgi:putative SOS response-associated peptidase YedK
MCGRLSSKSPREVIAKLYHARVTLGDHLRSYNVAPTEKVPIVREKANDVRTVDMARFGIPTTAPGRSFLLINLQAEKAAGRKDLKDRHCVIPADGFYEWEQVSKTDKRAHYFYPPEGLFSFAGIWKESDKGLAFVIFTTTPNELVGKFHNRMPVMLGHNAVPQWLAPEADPATLAGLMQPYPAELMREHAVSKAVNSVKNKDASCVAPV